MKSLAVCSLLVSDGTARGTRVLTAFPKRDAFFSFGGDYLIFLPSRENLKDRFVFGAHDGAHGIELWITDGTAKGTRLLRDVCPGACSGAEGLWYVLNGRLYFTAQEGTHGYELWSTDGTEAGTRLALDLCPGSCSSYPFAPFLLGGRILFAARDGQTGDELWSTDGTAAGTVRVTDFEEEYLWDEFHAEVLAGQLLFRARDPLYGNELWRTDGTPAGTQLVKDINASDRGGSFVTGLHALGNSAVFFADDGIHGYEPWRSHGPGPGASLIRDLIPGEEPRFSPSGLSAEEAGGKLFFLSPGLWRTDGTEAGTLQLLGPEAQACCLRAVGASVFFIANDEDFGTALWTSDGTAAGTRRLAQIPHDSNATSRNLIDFQGKLHFIAGSPAALWTSDGTEAGTVQVKGLGDGAASFSPLLTVHAGRLWFFAADDEHGTELWSSDGTEAGTSLAVELAPGSASFQPHFLASKGTELIVSGFMDGSGIWATDGTQEGTRQISSNLESRFPSAEAVFQGRLFLGVEDFSEDFATGLWVTDGTAAGTVPFHDRDGQALPTPGAFAVLGDRLLFVAGESLYQSDGTESRTFRIRDRVLPELVRAGDRAFFSGFDDATGWELWAVRP